MNPASDRISNTNEAGLNPIYPFDAEHAAKVAKKLEETKSKLREVAIFESKGYGDFNILVELSKDGKNFIASLKARAKARRGD